MSEQRPAEPARPTGDLPWVRTLGRRDVLKLGLAMAAGGAVAPWLTGCAAPMGSASATNATTTARDAGRITMLQGGGDLRSQPALWKVYDDFRAQHPGVEWDIRALPGGGGEWDRLARASIAAGEPVGLLLINGQQVRGWARDGLLADLGADPDLAGVLARVPARFHLAATGETSARAFPLAASMGLQTTGLYYNKAILDRAGLEPPATIADLKAMVRPLAELGVAPLVHNAGDAIFNPLLISWLLPMIVERTADPLEFTERTMRGEIRYDSPEWIEAFETIADLRTSGVLLDGSGATDYATMQQLLLQGKVAMAYNGTWLLPQLLAGSPTAPFDLHVAPLPRVEGASMARSILAWGGFALPAHAAASRESVIAFLEYASRPDIDRSITEGTQSYSPMPDSNTAIVDAVAQEFLPMLEDGITPLDWLWEPELTTEMGNEVQALVKGDTDAAGVGKSIEAIAEGLRSSGRSYYP